MSNSIIFLSVPNLRECDLASMPHLSALMCRGDRASLTASFPCVTWPVQANMLTGRLPSEHGVIANGFYWRDEQKVEMWTARNERIASPQIWDLLHQRGTGRTSAVWFPMLSKGCGADTICMPAPIHNPDGSEDLWCYTRPTELYGTLRDRLGHFPLQHFWGPLAGIQSSQWIADSAALAAGRFRPDFFYVYLPHLDYAAQKSGPDSEAATGAVAELDDVIGGMVRAFEEASGGTPLTWIAASEYVITPVDHVTYPNRILRDEGLLDVRVTEDGEHLDLAASRAWALVDHQFSHVYVRDQDGAVVDRVARLFARRDGVQRVLSGPQRAEYGMDHPRSGEVILISEPNSWQAYYWWQDDADAPGFARTVDIHRKPGYDPVELHFDPVNRCIPLDATLVRGSHGAPVDSDAQRGIILSSAAGVLGEARLRDTDVAGIVCGQW
jgi:hypothetical protein